MKACDWSGYNLRLSYNLPFNGRKALGQSQTRKSFNCQLMKMSEMPLNGASPEEVHR